MNQLTLVEESPSAGTRHTVAPGAVIGREGCEIVVADPEVSRRHAQIRSLDDTLAIEDLGSTNGTFVNAQRLTGLSELNDGDVIKIGNSALRVEAQVEEGATRLRPVAPAPAAAPPPPPPQAAPPPPPPAPPAAQPPRRRVRPRPRPHLHHRRRRRPRRRGRRRRPRPRSPPRSPPRSSPPSSARSAETSPLPAPASASRVHNAVSATRAAAAALFDPGGTGGTRRGSAATRVEATVVCYAVVAATAVGVCLYVLAEKV